MRAAAPEGAAALISSALTAAATLSAPLGKLVQFPDVEAPPPVG